MLILQNISYTHLNNNVLFKDINLIVNNHQKIALIGNNGTGKSTLFKIIAGELKPSTGEKIIEKIPYYIPQIFGQYNHLTISQALKVDKKLSALKEILNGNVTEENYSLLDDDWSIEERCINALQHWNLVNLDFEQKIETLSGGQKMKVFLAGIMIHQPEFILLDEPSNHLDSVTRQLLYDFVLSTKSTLMIISHDKKLLQLLDTICELSKNGIKTYGGNYDFYEEQKVIENSALNLDIKNKEKALRKAKIKERETTERQQKLDSRGKGKQEKAGVAKIMMNTLRNNAENSSAKLKDVHSQKIDGISNDLRELRISQIDMDKMKFEFNHSVLHNGKILFTATDINYSYNTHLIWKNDLNFQIISGERIVLKGNNGSGKTTLVKLILGNLNPTKGNTFSSINSSIYIDQDYSLLNNNLTVYEQAQEYNTIPLQEHEIKIRLNRFLFNKNDWDKSCSTLSGGEKMRLLLCCLTITSKSPEIIILDEPTNNLDIQNVEILTQAILDYKGSLIVISHDESFLEKINIGKTIELLSN
ncbi:ABC-F family ATP-binding cassette domain-containing protein [Empedobacter tilapiae]|uniref:ABC-F family ATP-binding cassette domain-containing protein n=1 Tax=Empedobacter tilapiae TaxID=2491114 RepID=UPI0028D08F26|nr:ABC-F family ATP-binding cassette domain-containing protein [Empedobacter tilapiae]